RPLDERRVARGLPDVSAQRADPRTLVATAARVLAVAGLFDMHGHISLRDGDVVYINDRGSSRITARPDQVAVVRLTDGTPVGDREPPSETPLHLAIYRARRDAGSVAHFHPRAATAFAVTGRPLIVASTAGAQFGEPREYTADETRRVRAALVQRSVALKTWNDAVERARVAGRLDDLD